ncbi:MAG: tryptophan--tRNA ligase [Candidatus Thermoplasmatota archaeon]
MQIDPWGSSSYQDYARLREQFGIASFGQPEWSAFANPHPLFRRGVVFGHRDFERVADALRGHDPWSVMTGFMPSGDLHLGHKMVLEQVIAHQAAGADIHLALADFEAMAARGFTREKAHRIALDQYVHNALALGLVPEGAEFYFQTRRTKVKDLAHRFAERINWTTLAALYGFTGSTSLAHALAPLMQAADILHPQSDVEGPRPVLVPVGVDQDPHIRLTRDIAADLRLFAVQEHKDGGLAIYVKSEEGASSLLDVAEKAVRDMGYGELVRNDSYRELRVRSGTKFDLRRVDLALARAEAAQGMDGLQSAPFVRPSATFHRFQTGLTGGKMSSSKPETSIFLTEDAKVAEKKLKSAVTGGKTSAEEQRRLGAEPDKCPVYELYLYHLAKDDNHLAEVRATCISGARLCGGCKSEAATILLDWMKNHKEKRDQVAHLVPTVVARD